MNIVRLGVIYLVLMFVGWTFMKKRMVKMAEEQAIEQAEAINTRVKLPTPSQVHRYPEPVKAAVEKLTGLNQTREALASTLENTKSEITEKTFKEVCAPVGVELKKWSDENKYQAIQISHKNRNPKHAVPEASLLQYKKFENDPQLETLYEEDILYVRIPVVSSCLHCHGSQDTLPEFIKNNYQEDKAFDFKIGDLRGLYMVKFPKEN